MGSQWAFTSNAIGNLQPGIMVPNKKNKKQKKHGIYL